MNMMKTIGRTSFSLLSIAAVMSGLLFFALPASAALTIVPKCATDQGTPGQPKPPPSLNCALQTFGNIAQLILGITGSFALLMFVYGGFTLLTSGGSSEKVGKGKTIITNAVIGIVIIFGSGLLIQYGMSRLQVKQVTIGGTCDAAGQQGVGVQMPSGETKCVAKCTEIPGYRCLFSPEATPASGSGCLTVPNCDAERCCPGAAPGP